MAFNQASKDDPLKAFGNFVRQNSELMHLDLSGVCQTHTQVKRIIKKAKKSLSLIAVHLSFTPVVYLNNNVRAYIMTKLQVTEFDQVNPTKHGGLAFSSPEEIERKLDWKYKYELVQRARVQQRERHYFLNQLVEHE